MNQGKAEEAEESEGKIENGSRRTSSGSGELALTIGTFDGVHRGHQTLLEETKSIAKERGLKSAAYTYDIPPKRYLGDEGPSILMEPDIKVKHLREYVDRIILGDFLKVKDYSPEEFVEKVLVDRLKVDAVVIGTDWRFGRNRSGSYRDLESLGGGRFSVHPKQQLKVDGKAVSSTWIRKALGQGNVAVAKKLLGRYPEYSGRVVRGHGVGSELGFPTANLNIDDRVVLPKRGSYAALAEVNGELFKGAVHIGSRPTFDNEDGHRLEVHLIDFEGDLYEKRLDVQLIKYLEGNKKYGDSEDLEKAIDNYIKEARRVLGDES
jgi:riboflavin kinase/FMN adenylyltransferase